MRCRNPRVARHRAQALKIAQAVLQRRLHTPAKVDSLCAEDLEDLEESEVEVRHCLSPVPRRLQQRLPRSTRRSLTQAQMVL
jgi:hypothetical protein